jgi:hypothetical protein
VGNGDDERLRHDGGVPLCCRACRDAARAGKEPRRR